MKGTRLHSNSAEIIIIGTLLTCCKKIEDCGSLKEDDFYFPQNKFIYSILRDMYEKDEEVDCGSVYEKAKSVDIEADQKITVQTLVDYSMKAGTGSDLSYYSDIVMEYSLARRYEKIIKSINLKKSSREVISTVRQAAEKVLEDLDKKDDILVFDPLFNAAEKEQEIRDRVKEYEENKGNIPVQGLKSGFYDLDKKIDGFMNSTMTILGARPAMGKTALALNLAENISRENKCAVLFVSLEMSVEQLQLRLYSTLSGIPIYDLKKGNITKYQLASYRDSINKAKEELKLVVVQSPCMTAQQIDKEIKKSIKKHHTKAVIIDYLQYIKGSESNSAKQARNLEVAEISRSLKACSVKYDIPVICLAQLSRKVDERPGHRPMMADLGESSGLEKDADVILFLTRRDAYEQGPPSSLTNASIIIAKNRHGETGDIMLTFFKDRSKFENWAPIKTFGEGELQ